MAPWPWCSVALSSTLKIKASKKVQGFSLNLFCKWVCTSLIILHLEVNQYIAITTAHIHLFKAAFKNQYIYIVNYLSCCLAMSVIHDCYFQKRAQET